MVNLNVQMSQEDFGELIGVSQKTVSSLLSRDVLSPGGSARQWLHQYCGHIREIAAGRAAAEGSADLIAERTRLAKEQADKVAMQNAERRAELAPVSAMEMVIAAVGVKVGKILDTIPGQVRRRVPGVGSDVIDAIASDIAKCRNMAASMTLSSLSDDDDEQADDSDSKADGESRAPVFTGP